MTHAAGDRRRFLKASAATVWGGSCLAFGLGAARAEAAATGRPVLTEASFNQMMREAQASGQIKGMAADARRDLKGWLERSFSLTPVQRERIQGMSPATIQEISHALAPIAEHGGAIKISFKEQVKKGKDGKDQTQKGALLGTIFGGPLVGTAIGSGGGRSEERRVSFTLGEARPAPRSGALQQKLAPKEGTR